ncbi:hypothetical protein FB2170_11146 [Maribacter sp. HTCC2170]|nr:hypothetical protein FB2170_11146 [Maribacter sp. HTCC2170]
MAGGVLFFLFIWSLPSELPMNIMYLVKAYAEPEVCQGAFEITKKDSKVLNLLGELEATGGLDMLNGSVFYSKGGDSVAITIDVTGDKEIKKIRSKMDLVAFKVNGEWEYQKIRVRIKQPIKMKQTIMVFDKNEVSTNN